MGSNESSSSKLVHGKSEAEWAEVLDSEQIRVCRNKGTERAFAGTYWDCKEDGLYACSCCGQVLFSSDAKFNSGTGWPSFFDAVDEKGLILEEDASLGTVRVEAMCGGCGAHLGHVFQDGPAPTGKRYCINSISLNLKKEVGG